MIECPLGWTRLNGRTIRHSTCRAIVTRNDEGGFYAFVNGKWLMHALWNKACEFESVQAAASAAIQAL